MSTDALMTRLAAADPARGAVPDREVTEALLEAVISSPHDAGGLAVSVARRRRRGLVIALAGLLVLAVAAAALAAVGAIRFGSPAPSSRSLENPRRGLGALRPGTARLVALAAADPAGGLPWGMRVLSTTRGVGCIEVGRLLDGRLGVIGQDGAFHNDGKFHELPTAALSNGGQCATLDANGRLFHTVSANGVPASGWHGRGSCASPLPPGAGISPPPADGYCPAADLRSLYYGLLGPDATTVTYTLDGHHNTVKPVGPEGAYLIVGRGARAPTVRGRYLLGGTVGSIMPLPWSSPITSIAYRNGTVCRMAATQPGTLKGQCTPPGYRPVQTRVPTRAQVAAPIHVRLITKHSGRRSIPGRGRAILVSFTARVAVTKAAGSYEIVEDTSSPEAVFEATQRDISAGQTVSWLLPAPDPGVYSGKVVLGLAGPPPYPVYTYSPGPLVGRFSIRVP
jgi:hypothetical protein